MRSTNAHVVRRAKPLSTLAFALACACLTAPAHADLIEYSFSGTIHSITGTPDGLWTEVGLGETWQVRAVVDTDTPDTAASANTGRWALESYDLMIGDASLGMPDSDLVTQLLSSSHSLFVEGDLFDLENFTAQRATVQLSDFTASAFVDDSLPTSIEFGAFNSATFSLRLITGFFTGSEIDPWDIDGSIDTVTVTMIPAPAALVLFGVAGLRGRRRRSA
jgi:hypothetical protein